jgi:hypothetical protein
LKVRGKTVRTRAQQTISERGYRMRLNDLYDNLEIEILGPRDQRVEVEASPPPSGVEGPKKAKRVTKCEVLELARKSVVDLQEENGHLAMEIDMLLAEESGQAQGMY